MAHRSFPAEFLGTLRVLPLVPPSLEGLEDLAYNLWWAWNPSARSLFRHICPENWYRCDGNPVRFMSTVSQKVLDKAAKDKEVRSLYDSVMKEYNGYLSDNNTWFDKNFGKQKKKTLVAYFSAEFGLHESLPIYSGGLGVLAGDHLKSASDLGIPFVATGLLYREGYFIQDIDADGQQRAIFKRYDWRDLPVKPALNKKGEEVVISVDMAGRTVYAKVWQVRVGRIHLNLLDTDIDRNSHEDRQITYRLYGGGQEMRVQQEILLGIGGVRALRALGHEPTVFHMNEGHSVFLALERVRELIHEHNLAIRDAIEVVRSSSLFTTHTPVPAGNDAFPLNLIERYFRSYWESIGMSRTQFFGLGLDTMPDGSQLFSMTVLALSLASMANGVSALHGEVSRAMWQHVWPDVPAEEGPISSITNGVHTRTWLSIDMQELFDKYFDADWRERILEPEMWAQVDKVPDAALWEVINKLRSDMLDFIHRRLTSQHSRFGESPDQLKEWNQVLNKDVFTIGFARRFATYKRATLIFRDLDRLARILSNPERPLQLVFAGKAHPADQPGQALIKRIQEISRMPQFQGRVVFIENYDMNVGRRLTSGSDVWLNTPRRPNEASGTSGMKVPLNGGLNCSILDGWWPEAYRDNPLSGWALGSEIEYADSERQDAADAEAIYQTIETEIVPMFYDRGPDGIPSRWLKRVRESMKACAAQFSTHRMVADYTTMFYAGAAVRSEILSTDGYKRARDNARWKEELRRDWPNINVWARVEGASGSGGSIRVSEKMEVIAEVDLGPIDPNNVEVQLYLAPLQADPNGRVQRAGCIAMRPDGKSPGGHHVYRGSLLEGDSGEFGYTVRVVPKHPDLVHPHELGLVRWARAH